MNVLRMYHTVSSGALCLLAGVALLPIISLEMFLIYFVCCSAGFILANSLEGKAATALQYSVAVLTVAGFLGYIMFFGRDMLSLRVNLRFLCVLVCVSCFDPRHRYKFSALHAEAATLVIFSFFIPDGLSFGIQLGLLFLTLLVLVMILHATFPQLAHTVVDGTADHEYTADITFFKLFAVDAVMFMCVFMLAVPIALVVPKFVIGGTTEREFQAPIISRVPAARSLPALMRRPLESFMNQIQRNQREISLPLLPAERTKRLPHPSPHPNTVTAEKAGAPNPASSEQDRKVTLSEDMAAQFGREVPALSEEMSAQVPVLPESEPEMNTMVIIPGGTMVISIAQEKKADSPTSTRKDLFLNGRVIAEEYSGNVVAQAVEQRLRANRSAERGEKPEAFTGSESRGSETAGQVGERGEPGEGTDGVEQIAAGSESRGSETAGQAGERGEPKEGTDGVEQIAAGSESRGSEAAGQVGERGEPGEGTDGVEQIAAGSESRGKEGAPESVEAFFDRAENSYGSGAENETARSYKSIADFLPLRRDDSLPASHKNFPVNMRYWNWRVIGMVVLLVIGMGCLVRAHCVKNFLFVGLLCRKVSGYFKLRRWMLTNARYAIIYLYRNVRQTFGAAGIDTSGSLSPLDFAAEAGRRYAVVEDELLRLTNIFHYARYHYAPLSSAQVHAAVAAFNRIKQALLHNPGNPHRYPLWVSIAAVPGVPPHIDGKKR
ncbi:MAG: hypothetical protein NC924_10305 [Candidatus Omnitrophica bacterium]|nr:hypothetical protein [Candidatus Omnitrophota bacterium]